MRQLKIFKAQPLSFDHSEVESLTIVFDEVLPRDSAPNMLTGFDAEALEQALHSVLPGGTYDRLASHMLQRVASQLIIRHHPRVPSQETLPFSKPVLEGP